MGSETPLKLPVIDFSDEDLKPGSEQWESVKSQVFKALVEYGCFEALFKKVPADLRKGIVNSIEDLFELPLQTKVKNVSRKPLHGYINVGEYPAAPLYESMGIDDADVAENVENFINVLWPQGNPTFSKNVLSYTKQVSDLDKIVRRMILQSLGVEKYLDEHMNSTNYLLRVQKYAGTQTTDTKLGLHPHTDQNIVTILFQNQVDGLEIKTKNGEWINVEFSPDSYVVMVGAAFLAWANGRLHSPYHRVMMSGNKTRYSAGLFSVPKAGCIIKAPEELIDEQHPLLFKPFEYAEFLEFYSKVAGQTAESELVLKTYCGV